MNVTRRLGIALALFAMLIVGFGCPDTDPLDAGNGDLTVAVRGVNAGATRYEEVHLRIQQIHLRPSDPTADAALGPDPLAVFPLPIDADLARGRIDFPSSLFRPGQYRITRLIVQGLSLFDDDPVNPPTTCVEGVVNPGPDSVFGTADDTSTISDPRFNLRLGSQFVFNLPGTDTVNITSSGGTLVVNVDVPMIAAAYESSFNCFASTNNVCIQQNNTPSINCLSNFNQINFVTMAQPAFSFD